HIYMDNNATTQVLPEVLDAMRPYWEERFGNASAVHGFGRNARNGIETAREQLAALLHVKASEIIFTSGGTESDNLALFGLLAAGDHLIVSSIEHDAVLHAAAALEQNGVLVTRVPCDQNGVVQPESIQAAMTPRTKLVSVMLANNETGVVQPVRAIAAVAQQAGAWMHTDAVQVCGKMPIDMGNLDCDLFSISAHKMHAPQGVGALWVRSGVPLRPVMHGGSHERKRRAGTENVPGIVGLGAAAAHSAESLRNGSADAVSKLRDRLEGAIRAEIPGAGINGEHVQRLPNTTCVSLEGVNAEELVIALDLQGLAISGGSACQSGAIEPSHVLRAMALTDLEARSTVRISMSQRTTVDEMDAAAAMLARTVERMRSLRLHQSVELAELRK
ncbi:MAG: cysteine desulfurase family protein, partial [Janthinobacterium lividum]